MSWFDTAGIASLAKNALKEAQKTIDKALDINDDTAQRAKAASAKATPVVEEDSADSFFSSWSVKSPASPPTAKRGTATETTAIEEEPTPSNSSSTIWGSFTGSFFEAESLKAGPQDEPADLISTQPQKSTTIENEKQVAKETIKPPSTLGIRRQNAQARRAALNPNRLSIISSSTGSPDDGCGSESVGVLGSTSESSLSPETAEACQQSSPESVGVIPGGSSSEVSELTSPSSVEVLGWSEANSPCSPSGPTRPTGLFTSQPRSQVDLQSPISDILSPASVEVIYEEESEASLADDSSTSASSTTTTTVMEPRIPDLSTSTHMRNMLAEAMEEQSSSHSSEQSSQTAGRDQHSPVSSLKSEPIKIECGQLSGHTSGDELETATSSDIEIISSPNGDGSSTHSRQSPSKMHPLVSTVRGDLHSSGSPDSASSDRPPHRPPGIDSNASSEEMLKKIEELNSLLEARETKLFELSKVNVELQENNVELRRQLETGLQYQAANTQDVGQITEEFTQRLSALERRFQQAIRDKEELKKQLDNVKLEASSKVAASELQAIVADKDEEIKELRHEGEKLSKQQLQLSTLVKKLRAKEKEMETASKTNKQHLSDLNQEADRLKKSLSAKEEVERSQIEAVNRLTAQVKRQDRELGTMQSQYEEIKSEKDRLQETLDSANKEMTELRSSQLSSELSQRQILSHELEEKQQEIYKLQLTHQRELEELRCEFTAAAESSSHREEALRRDHSNLLKKLQAAEARADELAQCTSDTTKPLLRQLEALQSSASSQQQLAERTEKQLLDKVAELNAKLAAVSEQERVGRASRASLEKQMRSVTVELAQMQSAVKDLEKQKKAVETDRDNVLSDMEKSTTLHVEETETLKKEISSVKESLAIQQAATDAERRHVASLEFKLKQSELVRNQMEQAPLMVSVSSQQMSHTPPRISPAPSLSESVMSNSWLQDELVDGGMPALGDAAAPTSALLESLQSQAKRREGEATQLRSQTRRLETQRAQLAQEVATLTAQAETQTAELQRLAELERKYDALLQMYGEQLEANQELRLDLDDVKEMYRTQIEALVSSQGAATVAPS